MFLVKVIYRFCTKLILLENIKKYYSQKIPAYLDSFQEAVTQVTLWELKAQHHSWTTNTGWNSAISYIYQFIS